MAGKFLSLSKEKEMEIHMWCIVWIIGVTLYVSEGRNLQQKSEWRDLMDMYSKPRLQSVF